MHKTLKQGALALLDLAGESFAMTIVRLPLVYAHLVGGQDEMVFDGASFAVQADGTLADWQRWSAPRPSRPSAAASSRTCTMGLART